MENQIELIGAAADVPALTEAVLRLLSTPQINLRRGSDFMGRPGTQIYACEQSVVKLRGELEFKETVARRWCLHTEQRERRIAAHHPAKAWFLLPSNASGDVTIGNIAPRLAPLHVLLQAPPISPEEIESRLGWLASVLAMDIQANREAATRLDLGLSNFGLDAEGRLYYLDDDFYSADDGWVAMAQTLGIYFRQYQWIDADFAAELGKHLRDTLLAHFPDPHCLAVLAGQLRGLFMPNEGRQTALQALVEALATGRTARAKPLPSSATHSARPRYFALLADVHANLPALEAALAFLDKENIRDGLVLGDVVGYGPHPVECIQRLQDLPGFALLQGNHDHAAATGICGQGFGNTARWCIEWTTPRLSAADKAWLLALPVSLQGEGWLAVHGAPVDPTFFNAYVYHMSYAQNLDVLEQRGIDLCFHGHTHMPGVYARNKAGADGFSGGQEMSLDLNRHSLVCPGSVGQPRNRETGSQLAVLDWQTRQLRFFNLPYAVDCVVADMEQADFPPGLSQRLLAGL